MHHRAALHLSISYRFMVDKIFPSLFIIIIIIIKKSGNIMK